MGPNLKIMLGVLGVLDMQLESPQVLCHNGTLSGSVVGVPQIKCAVLCKGLS
jgi:hypothetical protein